jgi:thiol-disulfide isomerase/thioredoxin
MLIRSWRAAIAVAVVLAMGASAPGVAAAQAPAPQASPETVRPGDVVPAFDAVAIDGTNKHVDYPKGRTTVLLFFLSSCPTCHRMIPEWNRIYAKKPKNMDIVGVMLDHEAPGFFETMPIAFPVLRAPAGDFRTKFKIARVPTTMRIGAAGQVEDAAVGYLDPIRLGQLFRP